jgi:NitT/TauT family transport system permease protein
MAGFLLAALVGIPLGLYIGAWARFAAVSAPLVEMARYVPVPALLPLCILWVGIGEFQKILIIFLGTFFQLIVAVAAASRATPQEFVDVARTLGLSEQKILWRVVLPAAWPSIFETLQISLGWAWSYLVVAEIVAAGSGIGYRIMWAQRYLQVGLVFVNILELAMLGLATDLMFRLLRKRLFKWAQ